MMDNTYNEPTRPHMQVPIGRIKKRPDQQRWILVIVNDVTYQLAIASYTEKDGSTIAEWCAELPYSEFWDHLRRLKLDPQKYWIIGHQMRYLLERTYLIQSLEKKEIHLPRGKKAGEKQKRAGRLTYSSNCLEIDLVAGRNNFKLLDWDNFGVSTGPYGIAINHVTPNVIEQTFHDFHDACDAFGFCVNRTTTAQLGWALFRERFLPSILSANMDMPARELERRAYFGGRNEPYFLGNTPGQAYLLDVNCYYASICRDEMLPVHCHQEYFTGVEVKTLAEDKQYHWIADVILETDEPDYPVRWAGLPVYPIGTFRTTLAWPELVHALAENRVKQVLKALRYIPERAFGNYARWYIKQRSQLTEGPYQRMEYLLKSSFNASLGYTARRKYRCVPWETHIGLDWFIGHTPNPETHGEMVQCQILEGQKQWVKIGGEPREAMPFLHATICSYGRMRLLRFMQQAGRENVFYVDTDGLMVNEEGYQRLQGIHGLMGSAPGQLSLRFDPGQARIQGQKNYKIGDHVVCAGLVRTRHSSWEEKTVLSTTTGRSSSSGRVYPFTMACMDEGGEIQNWRNELT